jgi:hypothetical protein
MVGAVTVTTGAVDWSARQATAAGVVAQPRIATSSGDPFRTSAAVTTSHSVVEST